MDLKEELIKSISEKLKKKYGTTLKEVEYSDEDLEKDIEELIVTQYFSLEPEELFNPIEQDIIKKIKDKNPEIEIKEEDISETDLNLQKENENENKESEEKESEEEKKDNNTYKERET